MQRPSLALPPQRQGETNPVLRAAAFGAAYVALLQLLNHSPLAELPLVRGNGELVLPAAGFLLVLLFRCLWDRATVASLGFSGPGKIRNLGLGLLIGTVLASLVFSTELLAGWIEVTNLRGWPLASWIPLAFLLTLRHLPVAAVEELVVRGYLLQSLRQRLGSRRALLASSVFFGLLHLLNATTRGRSVFVIPLTLSLFGMMLGVGYLRTKSLWLPIGLHFAWNLCEYDILALAGSGSGQATFFATRLTGPALFVGLADSAFGPEVGLLGVLACGLGILLIRWLARPPRAALSVEQQSVSE